MNRKPLFAFLLAPIAALHAADNRPAGPVKVLFFSKAASWEQKIIHRDGDELSYIEKAVQKLGQDNRIEFTFSKDGTIFTAENLAKYDAFFFYTSGDLTFQKRTGRGDNYPLMTLDGKKALLDAIHNGKGFIGCNTAVYTFTERLSPGEKEDATNPWRYTRMIGAGYIGHNEVQPGHFSFLDRKFPGMETVPREYAPVDQWYAFNKLMPDLHVIMAVDAGKLLGNLYGRAAYPVAWARMEGAGRVFYSTMGHTAEIWQDPVFLKMLLGGIRWAAKSVDANITPDIAAVTPKATEIPLAASKFVASHPTAVNPHFPNFKVWMDQDYQVQATKRVLVYTKSAGYEHPIVYRDTAWPSPLESELLKFGQAHHIDFVFSKDGAMFIPENLAHYDATLFYTSGDPTEQPRNGLGDNYPLMTRSEKQALIKAIQDGMGFIGIHSSIDMRPRTEADADPYVAMIGAEYARQEQLQRGALTTMDKTFPGMASLPENFAPLEEWYTFKHLQPDLHMLLALDSSRMTGNLAHHPNLPVAWTRMEGKGRVYYTSLGHDMETWKSPAFQQMLLGAIQWTTRLVDTTMTPNTDKVLPPAAAPPDK